MNPSREGEVLAGKYRLEKRLGAGGMGEVYRAMNITVERTVAIKLLHEEMSQNGEIVARFLREARAANRVHHPNVVDVLDVAEDAKGSPFIVQEFLHGDDLAKHMLDRGGHLAIDEALDLMLPIIDAVGAAHEAGVVHRDLKPENVFLSREGSAIVPKVLDFGISKIVGDPKEQRLTATGTAMGTPLYMAPEQIRGLKTLDARADVWSLGVILYEVITGAAPFNAETQGGLFIAICTEEPSPLPPSVPEGLARIIAACIKKKPDERPADAKELASRLRVWRADHGPVLTQIDGKRAGRTAGDVANTPRVASLADTAPGLVPTPPQPPVTASPAAIVVGAPSIRPPGTQGFAFVAPPKASFSERMEGPVQLGLTVLLSLMGLATSVWLVIHPPLPGLRTWMFHTSSVTVDLLALGMVALAVVTERFSHTPKTLNIALWLSATAAVVSAAGMFLIAHPTILPLSSAGGTRVWLGSILPWSVMLVPTGVSLFLLRESVSSFSDPDERDRAFKCLSAGVCLLLLALSLGMGARAAALPLVHELLPGTTTPFVEEVAITKPVVPTDAGKLTLTTAPVTPPAKITTRSTPTTHTGTHSSTTHSPSHGTSHTTTPTTPATQATPENPPLPPVLPVPPLPLVPVVIGGPAETPPPPNQRQRRVRNQQRDPNTTTTPTTDPATTNPRIRRRRQLP